MDGFEWIFPFVMAVFSGSLMILLMFFLRKTRSFAGVMSVWLMIALYLLTALRLFVPIELPDLHIIVPETKVYPIVIGFLQKRTTVSMLTPFNNTQLIAGIWFIVSLILLIRMIVRYRSHCRYLDANMNLASENEKALLHSIVLTVFGREKTISLKKTDAVKSSMVTGFFHCVVLIPDIEYTPQELEMIFRHECMHIKDKDIWIKLLIELYCIIFWWNPFSYLLKADINFTLETKCDLNVIRHFSDIDRLTYVQTVTKFMSDDKDRRVPFLNSRFSKSRNKREAVDRIRTMLTLPQNTGKRVLMSVVTVILFAAIFIGSYLIIIQPRIKAPNEDWIINPSDCYLILQDNGDYLFYYSDYPPEKISKEEVENGSYRDYPVYQSQQEYQNENH